uniref:Uncharacterized protein n=1 Tax=Triticum urartu TaxID=4572 RepID=A0A8R7P4D1_TRIUA
VDGDGTLNHHHRRRRTLHPSSTHRVAFPLGPTGLVLAAAQAPAVQWEVKQGGHVQINQQLLVVWLHRRRWSAEFSSLVTKLESVSSRGIDQERARYQKVEELKETIRTTEDAKNHSRKEYKLIKVSCFSSMRCCSELVIDSCVD